MRACKKLFLFLLCVTLLFIFIGSDNVSAATYSAGMSTSGSVTVAVSNSGNSTAVGTDNVTVTSTCPYGYNVSISGPSDRNLYKDGNSSNNTGGTYITPSSGTSSAPATITGNNQGTWGYSLSSSTGSGTFIGLSSTQATLTSKDSASASGGDSIPVYYGVSVSNSHTSGNYKMTGTSAITYYLTTNENCYSYLVSFNANGGTGTMGTQRIYEGVATPLNSNTFTPPTGMGFKEWNTKADGSGTSYTDGQSVTDITSIGTTLPLYAQWKEVPVEVACAANKICYGPTYPNSVVGTMGQQSANANASVDLLASNFSRTGYGFAGWNTEPDYTGTFYGPQETITTPSSMTGGMKLYAVWVKSEGSLQDSSKVSSVCSRLTQSGPNVTKTLSSVSALTDQRDNETYAIAKLADGNCWMIENLRLESANSDNSTGALAQGYGTSTTYGNFSGLANAESAKFNSTTPTAANSATNSLYSSDGSTTINIGSSSYPAYRMPRYNNFNHQTISANRPGSPTSNSANNSTTKAGMYSYGNYYTWAAAMANTGYYYTTTTDENGYTKSEAANTSLCPKGWKLPYGRSSGKGATSGGFSNLDIALGGTGTDSSSSTTPIGTEMSKSWRSFPNNFLYSGNFEGSSASSRGSLGHYWSSTARNDSYSYYLSLYSSSVRPGTFNGYKYYGGSIRCVDDASLEISYSGTANETFSLSLNGIPFAEFGYNSTTTGQKVAFMGDTLNIPYLYGYLFINNVYTADLSEKVNGYDITVQGNLNIRVEYVDEGHDQSTDIYITTSD